MCNVIKIIGLAVLVISAVNSSVAYAEIYKWKDGDVIRYSDSPPKDKKFEPLKAKKPGNGSVAATVVADSDGKKTTEVVAKTPEQKESERKLKEKACANAKDNVQKLKQGGIIYKENGKGEREYLDDARLKTETTAAEKEVEIACK